MNSVQERYQNGAPARHSRPSGSSSNPTLPSRVLYRPPNNSTCRSGPYSLHLYNSFITQRFPSSHASSYIPFRSGPRSFRSRTGHPYSVRSSLPRQGPPASTSRATTTSTNRLSTTLRKGRKSCDICSYSQKAPDEKKSVYHKHFSSKRLRKLLHVEFALSGSYYCPSCKTHHSPYPTERTKVVLSDSTLHNFFAPPTTTAKQYKGDTIHSDYVTIPGATLEEIFHAFKLEYCYHTKPLDVFVIGGYNDLVRNHSRDRIVNTIKEFVDYVHWLTNEENMTNTITVGSFLYPPQLAWFRDDGPEPADYVNQKEKIDWINSKVDNMNVEHGMDHYPDIQKYGTRVTTKKYTDKGQLKTIHLKTHRWDQWRETDRLRMLHLTNEIRFILGQAINEYFINRT